MGCVGGATQLATAAGGAQTSVGTEKVCTISFGSVAPGPWCPSGNPLCCSCVHQQPCKSKRPDHTVPASSLQDVENHPSPTKRHGARRARLQGRHPGCSVTAHSTPFRHPAPPRSSTYPNRKHGHVHTLRGLRQDRTESCHRAWRSTVPWDLDTGRFQSCHRQQHSPADAQLKGQPHCQGCPLHPEERASAQEGWCSGCSQKLLEGNSGF